MLARESERHKCTLKLLPYFFTREELANSNTDGTHGKDCLDGTKLNALKVLVFESFLQILNQRKIRFGETSKAE